MGSQTEDAETLCARVQLLTLCTPFSSPLTPCSFQSFPGWQPGLSPAWLPLNPSTGSSSSSAPHNSAPHHAPECLPNTPHHQLVLLCPPSQGCCQPLWLTPPENASWLLQLNSSILPMSSGSSDAKGDPKPNQKAALILHTKDFRAEEYEIQGGRKPKHLTHEKPFSSVNQNYF